jgi:hypothetical protein
MHRGVPARKWPQHKQKCPISAAFCGRERVLSSVPIKIEIKKIMEEQRLHIFQRLCLTCRRIWVIVPEGGIKL